MNPSTTPGLDVADAVLTEGYVLYPYRASAMKNRYRWMFGVLAPQAWSVGASGCEPSWLEAQCLVEGGMTPPRVDVLLRCFQICRRRVQERRNDSFEDVDSFSSGGQLHVAWDEGELRELRFQHSLGEERGFRTFRLDPARFEEEITDASGVVVARVIRERAEIFGHITISSTRLENGLWRLSVRAENTSPCADLMASREAILPSSCVGSHLVLTVAEGVFVSATDPPERLRDAVAECRSTRAYPVLLGSEDRRDAMLASPIILGDHPKVAPESPGDFCDAAEIDELLSLRTAWLTDEEKREARATDPRSAAIVDRVDAMPAAVLEKLHGAIRGLGPRESQPSFHPGMRVRLRPGIRRSDAQDIVYAGHVARVEEIRRDMENREMLAVTIEDDPAADLHRVYGRFQYYYPDEVELVASEHSP
jgi:hypothetical protein